MMRALPEPNLFEPPPVFAACALPISFVIPGETPSKKNSKKLIIVKGRMIPVSSTHYEKWRRAALKCIEWEEAGPLAGEVAVEITIFAGTLRAGDLTNKAEGCLDVLVEAGVLVDDNWNFVPRVTLRFGGVDRMRPRAEIVISARA